MIYIQLFLSFLQIGSFSFGGGYAALPLIQNQVVGIHHWMTVEEFTNLITISQMTPGPIAINSATFVGLKIAGIGGAVIATIGCILPSCLIVSFITYLYFKYRNLSIMRNVLEFLRPAVIAMIASAGLLIITMSFWGSGEVTTFKMPDWQAIVIFAVAVCLLRKYKWNPIFVMLLTGGMKAVIELMKGVFI